MPDSKQIGEISERQKKMMDKFLSEMPKPRPVECILCSKSAVYCEICKPNNPEFWK